MKKEKTFWYWLKYALNNGGSYRHEDTHLSVWGHDFSKVVIYQGKQQLTSEYKKEIARFNWIEKL